MKLFLLGCVMACPLTIAVPEALCQDNTSGEKRLHMMASGPVGRVALEADRIERGLSYPSVIRLKGHVEIKTKAVVRDSPLSLMLMEVTADEADYHEDTGEIEARGKVRVNYHDDPSETETTGNVRIKLEAAPLHTR